MIDRTKERETLRSLLAKVAHEGAPQTVLVLGYSGTGKSCLAEYALAQAEQRGMRLLSIECQAGAGEPLLPVRECLATARLDHGRRDLSDVLKEIAPEAFTFVPWGGDFMKSAVTAVIAAPELGWPAVPNLIHLLVRMLMRLPNDVGLCLVVDDVHRADASTLDFLKYYLRSARHHRCFTLITMAEECREKEPFCSLLNDWLHTSELVPVRPLEAQYIEQFVTQRAAGTPVDAGLVDVLIELTQGNPRLLEETLLAVSAEGKEGSESPEVWLRRVLRGAGEIPERIRILTEGRIREVSADVRDVLQATAVVIETGFDRRAIAHVAQRSEGETAALLGQAQNLGILRVGTQRLGLVHEYMRQALLNSAGPIACAFRHERAAQFFEQQDKIAEAATHYARADLTRDAARLAPVAAAIAAKAGLFADAVRFYDLAWDHIDQREYGPARARCLIMVGAWRRAEEQLDQLPLDRADVLLLRADLAAAHGRHVDALALAEQARALSPELTAVHLRIADINLYLGAFDDAEKSCLEALATLSDDEGAHESRARCHGILGALQLFRGHLSRAEAAFLKAKDHLPPHGCDVVRATLLDNLGQVDEARAQWGAARARHEQALELRKHAGDARGELHSRHALVRVAVAVTTDDDGVMTRQQLSGLQALADDLGARLEFGKIALSRSHLEIQRGEPADAVAWAKCALDTFEQCSTRYDIAHASLTLALGLAVDERPYEAIRQQSVGRQLVEAGGFGLLRRTFTDLRPSLPERLVSAMLAYACGDALGLPWEGSRPEHIESGRVEDVPARAHWAQGSTSDDTALMMLTAEYIAANGLHGSAADFLSMLSSNADDIKGLGPSTSAAIDDYRTNGATAARSGNNTNGALMRALPVGWATGLSSDDARTDLALTLSSATHGGVEARVAACVVAAMASWSVEGAPIDVLFRVAREEAARAGARVGAHGTLLKELDLLETGQWSPPRQGISLCPYETLMAVLYCLSKSDQLPEALRVAVGLGGDTDTVAAVVGALTTRRSSWSDISTCIPWHTRVQLPDQGRVDALARRLAELRDGNQR